MIRAILLGYELLHEKSMKLVVGDLVQQSDNENYDNNFEEGKANSFYLGHERSDH